MARQVLSEHIVIDSDICHGKPTFAGTRIMVWQILGQLSQGETHDEIVEAWGGRVSREAILEAIDLAGRAFSDHATEYGMGAKTNEHPRRKRARPRTP
jgi:uncharacterized protein (DUF433 family)